MQNKKFYEIVILGRGGQGAKSLGEIIALSAGIENKYVQTFPEFGPERSGAPVKTFIRIAQEKIRTRQPVINPDCLLVLDEKLLSDRTVFEELTNNEPIIINSSLSPEELKAKWKINQKIFTVDATGLAIHFLGKNFPNLGVLGKFIFITEKIKLESAEKVYEKIYAQKLDAKKIALGIKIIQTAYQSL